MTLGYHYSHAYPHSEKDTIEALPTMLKGVDKLMHEFFLATGLETSLEHALNYDFDKVENDSDNALAGQEGADSDDPCWVPLRDIYTTKTDEDDWFIRKEQHSEDGELVVLSNKLVGLSVTETGIYDGQDDSNIIEAWTRDFRLERVKWLN